MNRILYIVLTSLMLTGRSERDVDTPLGRDDYYSDYEDNPNKDEIIISECYKKREVNSLQDRNGIKYVIDEDSPYTGLLITYLDKGLTT